MKQLKLRVSFDIISGYHLHLYEILEAYPDGTPKRIAVMTNIEMADLNLAADEPRGIYIGREEAQALLDSLYYSGLRPSHDVDLSNIIKAKDTNLADLRNVNQRLFDLIEKE